MQENENVLEKVEVFEKRYIEILRELRQISNEIKKTKENDLDYHELEEKYNQVRDNGIAELERIREGMG